MDCPKCCVPKTKETVSKPETKEADDGHVFTEHAKKTAENITNTFTTALSDIKLDFGDFGSSLKSAVKGIGKKLLSTLKDGALDFLKDIGGQIFGAIIPGGGQLFTALSGLFGFAGGGRVPSGVPVVVGERGPELLVSDRAATVMNNHDSRQFVSQSSASSVRQTFHITSDVKDSVRAQIYQHLPAIEARIMERMTRARAGIR